MSEGQFVIEIIESAIAARFRSADAGHPNSAVLCELADAKCQRLIGRRLDFSRASLSVSPRVPYHL